MSGIAQQETSEGLVRGIRKWDLVGIAINSIIGAGIFGLPAKAFGLSNTYSLFAFLACAVVGGFITLCFSEVSSRYSQTGGPYLYAHKAFGSVVGFEVGWLLWLSRLTSCATICNLMVNYVAFFLPSAGSGAWRLALISVVVIVLTTVNLRGVRETAIVSNIFTIGKLLPIILFVTVGLFYLNPQSFSFAVQPTYSSFSTTVFLLVFAFFGFETSTVTAGEVTNPRRDFPFAMFAALGVVAVIYILIQVVCIGTLPELANSERPLADASSRFLGSAGGSIITLGALVSMLGAMNVIMLAATRVPFAMAERGQLPQIFAATHRRYHTPHISILFSSAVILVATLSNTFMSALTISTITRLITYAVTCASLLVLRRKASEQPALFRVPAGAFVSIVSLGLCIWMLSSSSWDEARDVGIAAVLGLLMYFMYKARRKGQSPPVVQEA